MAAKSSAKKTTSGKSAVAKKAARKAAGSVAAADKPERPKKGGGRKDPPLPSFWLTGTLDVEGGLIGMRRSDGSFISMADAAAGGHIVTLVFQPVAGVKTAAVQERLHKLGEFFEGFGVANIPCGYTCCGGP